MSERNKEELIAQLEKDLNDSFPNNVIKVIEDEKIISVVADSCDLFEDDRFIEILSGYCFLFEKAGGYEFDVFVPELEGYLYFMKTNKKLKGE
ncbi:MAG: hypothetical protein FWH53_00675 [Leptospirales bacterium]|nr:hypothetical protein [Leptospirales bacterium]